MEIARDEVRVMTVHGAKGLEAPIVILADTTTQPAGPRPPRLLPVPAEPAPPGTPDRIVWIGRKETDVAPVRAARSRARAAAADEYRRLLYVAMTRAADRLIICGTEGERTRPKGCWYDLVTDALSPDLAEEPADDGDGMVRRYRKSRSSVKPAAPLPPAVARSVVPPAWLAANAASDAPTSVPISPSDTRGEELGRAPSDFGPMGAAGVRRAQALARGRIVHRLMQSLPDIPASRRSEALVRHLARVKELEVGEREAIARQVAAVLGDPRFAALFVGSRAEVPIVGRIARPGRPPLAVSGQIDRLAITPAEILIADYKTNNPAPRRLEDVPDRYVSQLALCRAVLCVLFPDRDVRAALLWTAVPELMEIPAEKMDAALARVTCM
jgi:ATP-dependent helicase/nuclease subunit A